MVWAHSGQGKVTGSTTSRWRSSSHTPDRSCNSARDPMHTRCPLSHTHTGMQLPQYRLRLTAQSRASRSQFPNRFAPTASGTHRMRSLSSAIRSR